MTVHEVPLIPSDFDVDFHKSPHGVEYMVHSRHQSNSVHPFGILFAGPLATTRLVYRGPLVPGPHASLVAHATVIARNPLPVTRIEVAKEDEFQIAGLRYGIRDDRALQDPRLELLTPIEELTADEARERLTELMGMRQLSLNSVPFAAQMAAIRRALMAEQPQPV